MTTDTRTLLEAQSKPKLTFEQVLSEYRAINKEIERPKFEAWAKVARQPAYDLLRDSKIDLGGYAHGDTSDAWVGWLGGIAECRRAQSLLAEQQSEWVMVPREPTEAQWGGLARDIIMWMRMQSDGKHSGASMHRHLRNVGREIPDWLAKEIPDGIATPPKGTVAACIYKAMIAEASPQPAVVQGERAEINAPPPEHVEHIQWEGNDRVVLSPEDYEELWNAADRAQELDALCAKREKWIEDFTALVGKILSRLRDYP